MSAHTLMHGDSEAAVLDIDRSGEVVRRLSTIDAAHMPVGTVVKGTVDLGRLRDWWADRRIPAQRDGLEELRGMLGPDAVAEALMGSHAMSVSDGYWIRPEGENMEWADVREDLMGFLEGFGDALFGVLSAVPGMPTPDASTDGVLRKRWRVTDGVQHLVKAGSGTWWQEPYNEAIGSMVAEALGIPHAEYVLTSEHGMTCSACGNMLDDGHELVTAYRVMNAFKRPNDRSLHRHYLECCSELGVDAAPSLDRTVVLDYILCNGDRHTNNFGLVRDVETLEWVGPAPVFDCGSSLGHRLPSQALRSGAPTACKPFAATFDKQIELVSDFGWIDFDALHAAIDGCSGIVEGVWDGSDPGRDSEIIGLMRDQAERLEAIARRES